MRYNHSQEILTRETRFALRLVPPKWFVRWLVRYAKKRDAANPFGHLTRDDGSVYMERYAIISHESNWFDISVRIHIIRQSDMDPDLHSHPWRNISWLLANGYHEHMTHKDADYILGPGSTTLEGKRSYVEVYRKPGSILFRGLNDHHKLKLEYDLASDLFGPDNNAWPEKPVVTLFITGPWRQKWGFFTPKGWVYWQDYISSKKEHPRKEEIL